MTSDPKIRAFICHRKRRMGDATLMMWTMRLEKEVYETTDATNWPKEWKWRDKIPAEAKPGDMIFIRGRLRKRYLVAQVTAQRELLSTRLEVRFNRRTKRWVVFDTGARPEPRNNGYETLKQAKASVSLSVLERLAAEA